MTIYLPELAQHDFRFPPVSQALNNPDGLLAMGGDLSANRLVQAYRHAIFPWFSEGDPILWWSPSERAMFAPDSLQLNRSLRKQLRRDDIRFSLNQCFERVIRHCAEPRNKQPGTWILPQMQQAYLQLHNLGVAHSVEVWQNNTLVGGLYGLTIGGLFCGESMFNKVPNAAKLALIALQHHLQQHCTGWIDCQLPNPFLLQMGAHRVSRSAYLNLLEQQRDNAIDNAHWQPQPIVLITP